MAMGDGTGWDEALPADTTVASNIDDYNRDLRIGIGDRLGKEHIHPADASVGGEHKWITFQALDAFPTLESPATQIAVAFVKLVGTKHELFFRNKSGQEIQLTSDGDVNVTTFFSGFVAMYHGAVVDIPDGWYLCDGNNSTPDLRGKFVVGAGGDYSPGDTGGEDSHTLTVAELAAHAHTISNMAHGGETSVGSPNAWMHGMGGTHTTLSAGGGAAHENRPPFYALCFIMKS